jgi:hypothetical protein
MANHNAVAHAWAHQTGKSRKGFNMFYDGATIYSYGYHFPIATLMHTAQSEPVALFTSEGYSVSTAKHKTVTRRAIPSLYRVFYVPHVKPNNGPYPAAQMHAANHADILRQAAELYDRATRARIYGPSHLEQADRLVDEANAYNAAFELGLPEAEKGLAEARERIAEQQARAREAEARKAAEREAREADAISKWQAGEDVYPPHTRTPRVRVKGDMLETSWGVTVPLSEALPLFRKAQRCITIGTDWTPAEDDQRKVGPYPIRGITKDGTITVGCHIIPLRDATAAAVRAGLL